MTHATPALHAPGSVTRGDTMQLVVVDPPRSPLQWTIIDSLQHEVRKGVFPAASRSNQRANAEVTADLSPGQYILEIATAPRSGTGTTISRHEFQIQAPAAERLAEQVLADGIAVTVRKPTATDDQALWVAIRGCLKGRGFDPYSKFIECVLCQEPKDKPASEALPFQRLGVVPRPACVYRHGVNSYQLLKAATEVYLLCNACCSKFRIPDDFDANAEAPRLGQTFTGEVMETRLVRYLESSLSPPSLPYLKQILENLHLLKHGTDGYPFCPNSIRGMPCLFELIWSYWHEQGMLMQTINAIALRFQNRRVRHNGTSDVLANFALDPLRPLNNLLWGYVQDTGQRLTVSRRAYEYAHEYGLKIQGAAVGDLQPAESRSQFLETFHNLLHSAAVFYRDLQNKMMEPDAFPILEKLRSVHLLLAEGAHNQIGDLPYTARQEMMITQWLLAQPPMREFLQSRAMVPYDEGWMGQVDAMRKLMGWGDTSVSYFTRLAQYGEMILLSIRYGNWSAEQTDAKQAENWLIYWRPQIQGYIEAYRTVTGVDLAAEPQRELRIDATQPSELLLRRMQRSGVDGEATLASVNGYASR